ncbi:tetratricopeptide repeat protein [Desulfovibrio inopinatus]|uniref:tetratricopeptide repeat protein n=1 Tax=Desulfovibrio inopinatus TaxID=102109 RepID=UPI00041EE2E1|nr:tetratricopeptide repeat protein [Desulfovibrio inopinatus]
MSQLSTDTARWEYIALIAAITILLSPFMYMLQSGPMKPLPAQQQAQFVGSEKCKDCHETAYSKWKDSDHHKAMAVANDSTMLGDFNEVRFTDPYNHVTSRFYRKDDKFFVETEGPDGKLGEFEITYTFGVYPLQQYLVPFPGGRLQCLNIAWNVDKKQWYRLPPYTVLNPSDWLHWTNKGQTWNVMCAECHSTNVTKGYNAQTDEYHTTWSEIDVGCEACHGPGSHHLEWAAKPPLARRQANNFGLVVNTRNMTSDELITLCAPCHSRRFQLGDNTHTNEKLLDLMVPELLNEGLYYPDGQILDEVYVYGSFVQSKMYQRGVRCSDCHDIHSLKLHKEKNALCTQCHRADVYDTKLHHFHKTTFNGKPSEGYLCVKCHMPGRYYMGIDYRPDHSLRIPRPDVSAELGTPNACSAKGCHADKPLSWNIENYTKWYGETRKPHYGSVIAAGRARTPGANTELIHIADDSLLPAIVRATALNLLRIYPDEASRTCLAKALDDPDALIRCTAIRSLEYFDAETRLQRIAPKLYDPVKAVRMEAAIMLSMLPEDRLRKDDRDAFKKGLSEYREAMLYNADLAPQRYNLGNLAVNQKDDASASREYLKAIEIDSMFYPAKVNLAMLYNRQGRNQEAEKLLREVLQQHPEMYEVSYSLGLLLAEMQHYQDAAFYLGKAGAGMHYARAYYNQGQVLLMLNEPEQAEQAFQNALSLAPQSQEIFGALVGLYLNTNQPEKAKILAETILRRNPNHHAAQELLKHLNN